MSDLDPPVGRRPLPPDARLAREQDRVANTRNAQALERIVAEHMRAYRAALSELESAHAFVSDETDLDLDAPSRPLTLWLTSGRSIALGFATLDLLDAGHPNEAPALLRQLHETNRLVDAVAYDSGAMTKRWLADKWVSPGEASRVTHERHREIREGMLRRGARPPAEIVPDLNRLYGRMSEATHNRYRWVLQTVSVPTRVMPLGKHPDMRVRAAMVLEAGQFVAETVTVIGNGLAHILGREWFTERFNPTFQALQELHARSPLTRGLLKGGH